VTDPYELTELFITIDWTSLYLTKPSKVYLTDAAIPNSHNLHSTITERL